MTPPEPGTLRAALDRGEPAAAEVELDLDATIAQEVLFVRCRCGRRVHDDMMHDRRTDPAVAAFVCDACASALDLAAARLLPPEGAP